MPNTDKHRDHLLIVDDTPTNIEILLDALESEYEVMFATSGAEALRLVSESEAPDLILLDVMMPEMDGYEVCRRLKDNSATRDIPIIFVTAMGSNESESAGLALGADDYITKPINLDISRLRIKNVLERTRLGRELELTLACSNQGLWEWEIANDVLTLNARWAMPLGYAPGELSDNGCTWASLLHPDDLPVLLAAAAAHLNGGSSEISVELRMRNKQDAFSWMQVMGKGVASDLAGRPTRMIGTYMDISRRKRDEAVIEEHKNRLATLIESIPDTVLAFDTNGVLTDLHVPPTQIGLQRLRPWEKRPYSTIFPKALVDALDAGMIASFEYPAPQTSTFEFCTEGETRYLSATVSRLTSDGNEWPTGFLAVIRDVTQAMLAEEDLKQQALHDPLTSLPNRRLLSDRMQQAQLHSARQHSFAALLLLDLNKFKDVNDAHGHEVGDKLLIEVANRLQAALRDNDTVVRLGGDEFVVLLERLGETEDEAQQKAELIAEKLGACLSEGYRFGDLNLHCSASIGIKLFQGDEVDAEKILHDADVAMYRMKEAQRA